MAKSIQEWMREGESLHEAAVAELKELENQISELEAKRAEKEAEVNQIAGVLNRTAEPSRGHANDSMPAHVSSSGTASSATIARALAGRGLGR